MKKYYNEEPKKNKHLTAQQRVLIEGLLKEGASIRYIADALNKNPSTISREIKNHSVLIPGKGDCANKRDCLIQNLCNRKCKKLCKSCDLCSGYCPDYTPRKCIKIPPSGVCNYCHHRNSCRLKHYIYYANKAEKEYRDVLVNSRNGFDLTGEELDKIDIIATPMMKKGLPPLSVVNVLKEAGIVISESTLRRLIDAGELSAGIIDLRRKVKMKPRKKAINTDYRIMAIKKEGHKYSDYLEYIRTHEVSCWQMDTVEGLKEDTKVILTLHNPDIHFQLYFLLEEQTAECVVSALDDLEKKLGMELYQDVFNLILTDNGHEFSDIDRMEHSADGNFRTHIFFCEPNRSDQKGSCENNHHYLRYILPKKTSFEYLKPDDMVPLCNHINSATRKSLYGKCPMAVARTVLPDIFFEALELNQIPEKEVILTPNLLKYKAD